MNDNVIIPNYSQSRAYYHTTVCRKVWQISNKKYIPQSEAEKMRIEECAYCSGDYTQRNGSKGLYDTLVSLGEAKDD